MAIGAHIIVERLIVTTSVLIVGCEQGLKKSFFSADFLAKNRFSVGLETILGRKNQK